MPPTSRRTPHMHLDSTLVRRVTISILELLPGHFWCAGTLHEPAVLFERHFVGRSWYGLLRPMTRMRWENYPASALLSCIAGLTCQFFLISRNILSECMVEEDYSPGSQRSWLTCSSRHRHRRPPVTSIRPGHVELYDQGVRTTLPSPNWSAQVPPLALSDGQVDGRLWSKLTTPEPPSSDHRVLI